jgi:hypothetical protein
MVVRVLGECYRRPLHAASPSLASVTDIGRCGRIDTISRSASHDGCSPRCTLFTLIKKRGQLELEVR